MNEIRKAMLPKQFGSEPDWVDAALGAVNDLRRRMIEVGYEPPRNRHERRKAAALARRGAPSIAEAADMLARMATR